MVHDLAEAINYLGQRAILEDSREEERYCSAKRVRELSPGDTRGQSGEKETLASYTPGKVGYTARCGVRAKFGGAGAGGGLSRKTECGAQSRTERKDRSRSGKTGATTVIPLPTPKSWRRQQRLVGPLQGLGSEPTSFGSPRTGHVG